MTTFVQKLMSLALLTTLVSGGLGVTQVAQAKHGYYKHSNQGYHGRGHYNHPDRYYDRRRNSWVSYKTGKIIKGGLVGAGVGAGVGYVTDHHIGKSALVGAGIGAGIQALRY